MLTADNKLIVGALGPIRANDRDETLLARKVIRQTIKDLRTTDQHMMSSVNAYLKSPLFSLDCENAKYPSELLASLEQLVLLSLSERKHLSPQILKLLEKRWDQ